MGVGGGVMCVCVCDGERVVNVVDTIAQLVG